MQQPKLPSIVHRKARNADVVFLRGPDGVRRQVRGRWADRLVADGALPTVGHGEAEAVG